MSVSIFLKFKSVKSQVKTAQLNSGVVFLFVVGFALTQITFSCPVLAAGSSDWANQPAWASDTPFGNNRSRIRQGGRDQRLEPLAPFAPGSNNLALDLGQVFLMGDLAENYADNIGVQLHYTYGVSDIFGFDAALGRSSHSGGLFSMTSLKSGLRMNLSWYDRIIPFLVFGLGFYKPAYQISAKTSISPLLFGLHLGPGVDLQISRTLFFGAGITFHDIFGNTEVLQDKSLLEVGGTYTSFLLHAGVSF